MYLLLIECFFAAHEWHNAFRCCFAFFNCTFENISTGLFTLQKGLKVMNIGISILDLDDGGLLQTLVSS